MNSAVTLEYGIHVSPINLSQPFRFFSSKWSQPMSGGGFVISYRKCPATSLSRLAKRVATRPGVLSIKPPDTHIRFATILFPLEHFCEKLIKSSKRFRALESHSFRQPRSSRRNSFSEKYVVRVLFSRIHLSSTQNGLSGNMYPTPAFHTLLPLYPTIRINPVFCTPTRPALSIEF